MSFAIGTPVSAPSSAVRDAAAARVAGLATPAGALGRLGDLAVWVAATQAACPPKAIERVRAVVFGGDHGIADHGVSAYPKQVTPAMVRAIAAGTAGVCVLARQHGVRLRVLDLGVDDELAGIDPAVQQFKVRRSSGAIHLEDALSREEALRSLDAGAIVATEEVTAGAQLLIAGDLGIGNTTVAAALIAASLGVRAAEVTGRGTGIDDATFARKQHLIQQALDRVGERADDPLETLIALGSADLAATTGFLATAARSGVPVILDGVISLACALLAERLAPGAMAWFAAGHRSGEPAQELALEKLGLSPILDLGMRLGEGSGAMAALPLVRSTAALLAQMALLADLELG